MLDGVRVLDFATVGPAARASRWLADYGAEVVKVGAPPRQSGVQIEPPYYAYSGHRGMRRVKLDLKADDGREAFLALARSADVVIESFRPAWSTDSGWATRRCGRSSPTSSTAPHPGSDRPGPAPSGPDTI